MKQLIFVLGTLLWPLLMEAQSASLALPMPQTSLKAAYLGSFVYPGFKLGLERPYKVIQFQKNKKGGGETMLKERYLSANLGYYHHETFHDNVYLLLEHQKRRQHNNGWFLESAAGIGFSRTFLGGTTYAVSEDGEVRRKNLAGHNYAVLSASFGGGYNFAIEQGKSFKPYGKISLLGMFPSNSFVYLRPTVELGLVCAVPNFLKANPTLKTKQQ